MAGNFLALVNAGGKGRACAAFGVIGQVHALRVSGHVHKDTHHGPAGLRNLYAPYFQTERGGHRCRNAGQGVYDCGSCHAFFPLDIIKKGSLASGTLSMNSVLIEDDVACSPAGRHAN